MASPTTKTKETSTITPCQKFGGHTEWVWSIIHLPDGQRVMTGSYDGSLRMWDVKSGKQIGNDWRDGESKVYGIALSPDGKKVVSASEDGAVRLWDIDTCKIITKWMGHKDTVKPVCWSRDGRRVLSGSEDGTARQWDVEPEKGETILASIETGHREVRSAVYSPDTTLIATGGSPEADGDRYADYFIKIWDAKTGKQVTTLKGHTSWVNSLAWTMDGKTLISASSDCSIRTWDTKTWKQIRVAVLDERMSFINALAISPNGRVLASASYDKTVRLWNLEDGQPINLPLQHVKEVTCVSFSVDGKTLATGCHDHNAYLWDVAAIIREAGLDVDPLSDPKVIVTHLISFHEFKELNSLPKGGKKILHVREHLAVILRRPMKCSHIYILG
jgi:WD40 repeat protein